MDDTSPPQLRTECLRITAEAVIIRRNIAAEVPTLPSTQTATLILIPIIQITTLLVILATITDMALDTDLLIQATDTAVILLTVTDLATVQDTDRDTVLDTVTDLLIQATDTAVILLTVTDLATVQDTALDTDMARLIQAMDTADILLTDTALTTVQDTDMDQPTALDMGLDTDLLILRTDTDTALDTAAAILRPTKFGGILRFGSGHGSVAFATAPD